MKQYDKEKPLIFLHIPKCAGTSFMRVLWEWFGNDFYRHYFDEENNKMPPKVNLKGGICIQGHFNKVKKFGVMDYYPEVDQFITILRDPFEIAVSNYFYIKKKTRQGGNWLADRPRIENQYRNISGYLRIYRSNILNYIPYQMTMDNHEEIFEKYFVYVGIAEDMQTSVNMLARKLDFCVIKVSHENISERDEEVPIVMKEEFISKHQLEYAIYNYTLRNYKQ
jgi:hypothetical protein